MKIEMLKTIPVAEDKINAKIWKKGTVHNTTDKKLAKMLIDAGIAKEAGVLAKPEEKKEPEIIKEKKGKK